MGKLTPEQAQKLKELQDLEASEDDDECVVWVRNSKGHETRLEGERARRWLRANGYDEDDADDSTSTEPLDAKGAKSPAPAKKAAPAGKGKPADDGQGDELDVDGDAEPPVKNKRAFF